MCGLCNPDTREQEQATVRAQAAEMRRLAAVFDGFANGSISTHSDIARHTGDALGRLFRELNEDWMGIPIERT